MSTSSSIMPLTSERPQHHRHPPPPPSTTRRPMTTSTSHPTPRTAQTRSMTKLAQNRSKHLEQYIQQQQRQQQQAQAQERALGGTAMGADTGRTVFGGKVGRGKRGVLLDSLKNVGAGREEADELMMGGVEGKKKQASASGLTGIQAARTGISSATPRETNSSHTKTPHSKPPVLLSRTTNPQPFVQDDESEDELLLTPRKRPVHPPAPLSSNTNSAKTTWQRSRTTMTNTVKDQDRLKSGSWKSTLGTNNTPPKAGPSPSSSAAGPVKRKRPSNGPLTPTIVGPSSEVDKGLIRTPNRSSSNVMVHGSGGAGSMMVPNTVTPERRHTEKRRRISDSPTKVSGGKNGELFSRKEVRVKGIGEDEENEMEVEKDVEARAGEMEMQMDLPRPSKTQAEMMEADSAEHGSKPLIDSNLPAASTTTIPRPAPSSLNRSTYPSSNSFAANTTTSSFPLRKQVYPSSLGPGASSGSSASTTSSALPRRVVRTISDRKDVSIGLTAVDATSSKETLPPRPTRREGLGSDVKGSLYGLSAALAKLQVKASVPPPGGLTASSGGEKRRMGGFAMPTASSTAKSVSVSGTAVPAATTTTVTPSEGLKKTTQGLKRSSTMNGGAKRSSLTHIASNAGAASGDQPPRQIARATSTAPESTLSRSFTTTTHFQALIDSDVGSGCLKGVVAYVDVRTAEGDDAGSVFIEMLRTCGAKVLAKPSESCTHIVYKSGKSSTLAWHRRQEDPKPFMVGISWVTRCKESGKHLDEEVYKIDPEQLDIFKKRRRSMEPKQLQALLAAGNAEAQQGDRSMQPRRLSGQ